MEKELIRLGLRENEAKIYLALLGMRVAAAGVLAKKTNIKRSTTYLALNNLVALGVVLEVLSEKKKLFRVEGPESLRNIAKRMHRKAVDTEKGAETLILLLRDAPHTPTGDPAISLYKGMDGIKNVLLDIASSEKSWYLFGSSTEILKKISPQDLGEVLEEGEKFRKKSGRPKVYFITDSGLMELSEFSKPDPQRREIKILPGTIKASSALIISEDKLVVLNFTNPFAAVIKNEEITEIVKLMYELIWKSLPVQIY